MLTQHVVRLGRPARPLHLPGEVVWVSLGNYRENPANNGKMRPAVILDAGAGQHRIAGLTTQAHYASTGTARVRVPIAECCGLCGRPNYLWGRRPSWISRLYVRTHAGWVDEAFIDTIAAHMDVPWHVIERVRDTVAAHAD
jgi:hypothetical protein